MYMSGLCDLIQEVVLSSKIKPREIAERIGKPYSTLMRECNPNDDCAKIGVETLLSIMQVTGNFEPLKELASRCGYNIHKRRKPKCESEK